MTKNCIDIYKAVGRVRLYDVLVMRTCKKCSSGAIRSTTPTVAYKPFYPISGHMLYLANVGWLVDIF
jgi:hypothetical protein